MNKNGGVDRPVKTARKTFELLEHIKEEGGGTPTEIAAVLGNSKSTIHRYLITLEEDGYLVKRGEKYHLSLRFLDLGVKSRDFVPMDHVVPKVDKLSEETGEVVWFVIEEAGECVYLYGKSGENSIISGGRMGARKPMHSHAAGKAILSCLPDERVHEIVDMHGLPEFTSETITDKHTLFEELERIREEDIAYNYEESVTGIHAVSSSIDLDEPEFGAITIVGPSNRFEGEYLDTELANLLMEVTNEIEVNVSFS